jgi:thiol-disulfide isomerase/thioredoxin
MKKAPALSSPTWLNSTHLTMNDLQGKVVVLEFWTFACYNCKNTLPYVKAWDEKYREQGLVTIGVHSPELSFERDLANVRKVTIDYGIKYPIALDTEYSNWNRYHIRAWPTWFIIDKGGYIRYSHIGEGDYARSESVIKQLLAE